VDLVLDKVVELEHVDVADGDVPVEGLARPSVAQLDLAVDGQAGFLELLLDLLQILQQGFPLSLERLAAGQVGQQPHVVRLESTDFELPSYLQIGVAYDLGVASNQHATLYGTFQGNNFSTDEYRLGAEYMLGEHIALRGGYVGQAGLKSSSRQSDYLYSFSYGAGLNFKLGERPVGFDYAGTHVGQFFEDNQQVSLKLAF